MPRQKNRGARGRESRSQTVDPLATPEHAWWAGATDEPTEATNPIDADDPYTVLRVSVDAEWDDIVASYRRLARWWHPDGLTAPSDEDREACETMIRRLNSAYAELRVRRGKGRGRR